ncbi:hypothetical protein M5689_019767 [Euphorbia peplus]|nr:hypothetical protein M5689_019767 [Euphorbia peplus]
MVCYANGGSPGESGGYVKVRKRVDTEVITKGLSSNSARDDMFFGIEDMSEIKDLTEKDDILVGYRREKAMKNMKTRRSRRSSLSSSIFKCFEFIKVIFRLKL